ncbi:hypothetical protein STEG23_023103 [Scotinomys teguina]
MMMPPHAPSSLKYKEWGVYIGLLYFGSVSLVWFYEFKGEADLKSVDEGEMTAPLSLSPCHLQQVGELTPVSGDWKICPFTSPGQHSRAGSDEWIRKMWHMYTVEYYKAEKNNDIMKFAGKWMELENVILSKAYEMTAGAGEMSQQTCVRVCMRVWYVCVCICVRSTHYKPTIKNSTLPFI